MFPICILYSRKNCGRKFPDFVLKQSFRMNLAICILLFSLVRISQINFRELGEIAKNTKFFRRTVNQSTSHLLCMCGPLGAGLEPACSHAQFTVAVVVVETVRLVLLQEGPQLIVVEIDVKVF